MLLSEEEKEILLLIARNSIAEPLGEPLQPVKDHSSYQNLKENNGAFVTLTIGEKLRGCIGFIISKKKITETIAEAALQAAFFDPRFPPLSGEELKDASIEISVLSKPANINNYSDIKLGTHGLMLDDPVHRAVLLPQVAEHGKYTLEKFLSILCEKGGLPGDSWRTNKLKIRVFTADVFSEKESGRSRK